MDMPLRSMMDPKVTALFYHTLFRTMLATGGTLILIVGGWWLTRHLADEPPTTPLATPVPVRGLGYRILYGGLGALWMVDAMLQLQPAMPNSAFVEMVITPTLHGQPPWFLRVLGIGAQLWSTAPITADLATFWIQLAIGLVLVLGRHRPWGRWGLWATLGWGLIVWIWGEGLGSLLADPSWVSGDPGAVFFYMVSAVLLLLPDRWWSSGRISRGIAGGMAGFWLVGAAFQAAPESGYWTQGLIQTWLNAATNAQPAWISTAIYRLTDATLAHPLLINGVVVTLMFGLGLLWLWRPWHGATNALTLGTLLALWWFGQDFGVLGGVGTDVQTAPLIALILVAGTLHTQLRTVQAASLHGDDAVPRIEPDAQAPWP
ncbi:MAG: hypothetical protein M0Z36_14450 [Thermaerobacter sp.]|nr:hypothetical protein [Thermaerobacter sp.]